MRLLHTSDWHLGRSFHREGLLAAQAAFVDFMVETVRSEHVDTVLVSGDVFDRALPPVDAVALGGEALRRLADAGARVVLISGNHDSARRLGFAAELISAAGVHLRTDPSGCGRPVVLEDAHGPVAIYPLPYLEPDLVRDDLDLPADTRASHEAVVTAAMHRVRDDLTRQPARTRSVVLAHAFAAGGLACESERDVSVGGVSAVPLPVFAGVDYTALGHLHGRQTLAPAVRYSGSPLAYSFSEEHQTKGIWLVELDATGLSSCAPVDAPVPRRIARIRGPLDELLAAPRFASYDDCWLHVTLTDAVRPREPMERLRARFPHTLALAFEPEAAQPGTETYAERMVGRSDLDIALDFVAHVRQRPASDDERQLFDDAFVAVRTAALSQADAAV